MQEDFSRINSDDIFNPVIIENLLKSPEQITMVVDFKDSYDEDDMNEETEDRKILLPKTKDSRLNRQKP